MAAEKPALKDGARPSERPSLTGPQQDLVLRTAGRRVAAAVRAWPAQRLDEVLGDTAKISVLGAFVSLKRSGQLRSCCGFLGPQVALHEALDHAAVRAAKDDPRFPPISVAELPYLDLEVWLLWNMQPVAAQGKDRVKAVVVGTHGLQISRGANRGLLLPGVPVEHQWDAETFLRQVCLKAGLPPEAWQERDTVLSTFEGFSIHGKMGEVVAESGEPAPVAGPTLADVTLLADFCRANVIAHFYGATPNYYAPAGFDGGVNGVVVSVGLPGRPETVDSSIISIRPEMPLQSTLFNLTKAAADSLAGARIDPRTVEGATCSLSVFWDPAMHGPLGSPDLAGIDPRRRAVVVMDQSRWVLAYDPSQSAQALFAACLERIAASENAIGQVCSLEVASTQPRVLASNVPVPQPAGSVRPPAVAGRFYPGTPETVDQMIGQFTAASVPPERWAGVLVPHAGWMYSGRLAFQALSRVKIPSRVIVICPKHRPGGAAWAVSACRSWALPGREVQSDLDLAQELARCVAAMALDNEAHREEHAIEVQLPLLARLAPDSRVVGVAIHGGDFERLARSAEQLAGVLRGLDERPLLVISSDMNHYADDDHTRRVDRMALDAIESLDPRRLYETVTKNRISMCGVLPAVLVMETLRQLGDLNRCETVGYATSGDVSGDRRQVVGYAAALFA
jgi:AmmeMemoRadiSam system protein B/AmmeMemoRadiSam system protein A